VDCDARDVVLLVTGQQKLGFTVTAIEENGVMPAHCA